MLVAVGRAPLVSGIGLKAPRDKKKGIEADEISTAAHPCRTSLRFERRLPVAHTAFREGEAWRGHARCRQSRRFRARSTRVTRRSPASA